MLSIESLSQIILWPQISAINRGFEPDHTFVWGLNLIAYQSSVWTLARSLSLGWYCRDETSALRMNSLGKVTLISYQSSLRNWLYWLMWILLTIIRVSAPDLGHWPSNDTLALSRDAICYVDLIDCVPSVWTRLRLLTLGWYFGHEYGFNMLCESH